MTTDATTSTDAATLYARLRDSCAAEWTAYAEHEFVRALGAGSLPQEAFRDYLAQDYLFLIQFARAHALAAFKSRSIADIRAHAEGLGAILSETELHVRLAERWGVSAAELEALPEKQATVAYTRYVLDCGMSGDLLDLEVALAPCVIGYAEIGARLAAEVAERSEDLGTHPYGEWISEYAGETYQSLARDSAAHIDALAGGSLPQRRIDELTDIFRTATRLEADFWQQALDH